jgi:hypothetical protein
MLVVKSVKIENIDLEDSLIMAHAILNIIGNQKEESLNTDDLYFACKAAKTLLPTVEDMEPV